MPGVAALLIALLPGVLSQTVTLTGIALIDKRGDSRFEAFVTNGRLLATLTTSASGVAVSTNSTVCGSLDSATASFLCGQLGYISTTLGSEGAVYGSDEDTAAPISIRNLDCNGASSLEACQFEVLLTPDPSCTHSQDATLECILSVGGIAGLASGLVGTIGVCTGVPILIVIIRFCCCRKRC